MVHAGGILKILEQKREGHRSREPEVEQHRETVARRSADLDRLWEEFVLVFHVLREARVKVGDACGYPRDIEYVLIDYRPPSRRRKKPAIPLRRIGLELGRFPFNEPPKSVWLTATALQDGDDPVLLIEELTLDEDGALRRREFTFRSSEEARDHLLDRLAEYEVPAGTWRSVSEELRNRRSRAHLLTPEELRAAADWIEGERRNAPLALYLRDPDNWNRTPFGPCLRVVLTAEESDALAAACVALGIGGCVEGGETERPGSSA